jgi:HPt (histidine-containing phosphotransfer) domain-containing protein
MDETEFQRRFHALQERFRSRLPDDRAFIARQASEPVDPAKLKLLAHQYSGNGATFGFPEISAIAQRLDKALAEMASPEIITQICYELCSAFDRAI